MKGIVGTYKKGIVNMRKSEYGHKKGKVGRRKVPIVNMRKSE